jgi:hypothetical protein
VKNILIVLLLNIFIFPVISNLAQSQDPINDVSFYEQPFMPGYGLKKIKNPEMFQGNRKRKEYFEGWYFKMVSSDGSSILSVIPGISLSEDGETQHAFIQLIDGNTANTFYYKFSIEEFMFSKRRFAIGIAKNYFSSDSLILDIQNDTTSIKGKVYMSDQVMLTKNNKKKKKVGIMGRYRFVPFMQCYHGVVSLNHNLSGSLSKDNKRYRFDGGLGYIEKDWGKSMPSSWIWLQSNNFSSEKTSFMLSIADIPWIGRSFTGFLGFFLHEDTIHRFGTYTNARLRVETSGSDTLKIAISDKKYTYHIKTYRNNSGILKAPVKGSMDRRISESVDAKLNLVVTNENGVEIFQDSTSIAGLEMVGNIELLINSLKKSRSIE